MSWANASAPRDECSRCEHFRNDPAYLEAAFGGLTSLGSAYGSTRAADGICLRHDRFVEPRGWCAGFVAACAPAKS